MPSVGDREYTIEVPGIPAEEESLAKKEIGGLVDGVAAVVDALGAPFPLKAICVTDRFEDEVNRLLQERSGTTGYAAVRSHVRAIGKTLPIRSEDGDLGFAVIIDAKQVDSWDLKNSHCLTTVLHELFHVFREGRHLERLGEEEYTADTDTRERLLDRRASGLLDEFYVDRLVDASVRALAKKDDGTSWSLRELAEAQGVDWPQTLLDGLYGVPQVVDDRIQQFLTSRIGIDELAAVLIPNITDLLTLLSHTASRYMGTERWPDIVQGIKETEASRRFLRQHLDTILGQLYDSELPSEESVQIVAHALEGVFGNCGLGFKTIPEGMYISVDAPSP